MISLKQSAREFIAIRRILGLKLEQSNRYVMDFVSFLEKRQTPFVTTKLAYEWSKLPITATPHTWGIRMRLVRQFARYRHSVDPRTEIPPFDLLRVRYRRKEPHFYKPQEIWRLLKAALSLQSPFGFEKHTYFTLIGLCVCTGLRRRELIALNVEDVDIKSGILSIRMSKFGKSRLVPIHPSTVENLRTYNQIRRQILQLKKTENNAYFLTEQGRRLAKCSLNTRFVDISRSAGIRGQNEAFGPRLHDIRHTFAITTLINWCQEGGDVDQKLPRLSTYLGHVRPTMTYWYFSCVPELMRHASDRLQKLGKEFI